MKYRNQRKKITRTPNSVVRLWKRLWFYLCFCCWSLYNDATTRCYTYFNKLADNLVLKYVETIYSVLAVLNRIYVETIYSVLGVLHRIDYEKKKVQQKIRIKKNKKLRKFYKIIDNKYNFAIKVIIVTYSLYLYGFLYWMPFWKYWLVYPVYWFVAQIYWKKQLYFKRTEFYLVDFIICWIFLTGLPILFYVWPFYYFYMEYTWIFKQ